MRKICRKIKVDRDPYEERKLFLTDSIEFTPGVTVLVGCNGSGKTTVINYIENTLFDKNIPFMKFDNVRNGGSRFIEMAMMSDNIDLAARSMVSSEGERVCISFGSFVGSIKSFVNKYKNRKELWILCDGLDSGLSIDNIDEFKDFFRNVLLPDLKDKNLYLVIAGNQYGMAEDEDCINVRTGEHIRFGTYEEYRDFIRESRKEKDISLGITKETNEERK